ncbi:MAG: alpha-L-arabinofuranosidase C-terminal domain-containing protein, partial [Ignavibacteriaceae bacterium]
WLDMVSLFPKDTFKNRPNGLRKDLAEMLAALKPSFVRFPGGCFVEGFYQLKEAWRPLETIGDIAQRPELPGARWQYGSTNGFGYYEMLQMCEDFGAEPLLVANVTMSHGDEGIIRFDDSGAQFPNFLRRTMDAIEYANGDTTTEWDRKRAENGHPKSFDLKYIELGNEDNLFPSYEERYDIFGKAIKDKYPQIHIIANSNMNPQGIPKKYPVEIVDEHYYPSLYWCLENFHKYDSYNRKGPKVYVGEFGVISLQDSVNYEIKRNVVNIDNLSRALGEAVFLLGAERNSDVVKMESYSELMCRIDQKMWASNLIYFDQSRVYGTPSYYVFKLLSNNRGDVNLNAKTTSIPLIINNHKFPQSIYAGATLDEKINEVILKVVNFLSQPQKTKIYLKGIEKVKSNAKAEFLASTVVTAQNSLENPLNVSPKIKEIYNTSKEFTYEFPANSFTVIRISISNH